MERITKNYAERQREIYMLMDLIDRVNEREENNIEYKTTFMNMLNDNNDCVRQCSVCGNLMYEGYCIEGGVSYYCTDECMSEDGMTREEFEELYADGDGDSYWTSWI